MRGKGVAVNMASDLRSRLIVCAKEGELMMGLGISMAGWCLVVVGLM
jgi:hypothetical protein